MPRKRVPVCTADIKIRESERNYDLDIPVTLTLVKKKDCYHNARWFQESKKYCEFQELCSLIEPRKSVSALISRLHRLAITVTWVKLLKLFCIWLAYFCSTLEKVQLIKKFEILCRQLGVNNEQNLFFNPFCVYFSSLTLVHKGILQRATWCYVELCRVCRVMWCK